MNIRPETHVTAKINDKLIEGHVYNRDDGIAVIYDNTNERTYKLSEARDVKIGGKWTLKEAKEEFGSNLEAMYNQYDMKEIGGSTNADKLQQGLKDIGKAAAAEYGINEPDAEKIADEKLQTVAVSQAADSVENNGTKGTEEAEKILKPFKVEETLRVMAAMVVKGKIKPKIYEKLQRDLLIRECREYYRETGDFAFAHSKLIEAGVDEDDALKALAERAPMPSDRDGKCGYCGKDIHEGDCNRADVEEYTKDMPWESYGYQDTPTRGRRNYLTDQWELTEATKPCTFCGAPARKVNKSGNNVCHRCWNDKRDYDDESLGIKAANKIKKKYSEARGDLLERKQIKEAYGVYRKGGSMGDPGGKLMKTFDDQEAAKDYAKRMRSQLSKGEKSFYGMGYVVKPLKEAKTRRQSEILQRHMLDCFDSYDDLLSEMQNHERNPSEMVEGGCFEAYVDGARELLDEVYQTYDSSKYSDGVVWDRYIKLLTMEIRNILQNPGGGGKNYIAQI